MESGFGARSELDRWGECMKSHGLLVSVGISFVALSAIFAGCSLAPEPEVYPNGKPRPPGGEPMPATGSSGGGGTGGTGGGTGGTGGGASCGDSKADTGESCDDGNKLEGDGCSSTCQVEACWDCSSGACMPIAPNASCNNGTQVCDGKGSCGDCVPVPADADMVCDNCKSCAGSPCIKNGDCASDVCITGVCRSATGSACGDSVECATDYCDGQFCAECTDNAQCPSGSCNTATGQCYAAIGEPCDAALTCGLGLNCTSINICKKANGSQCTHDHECVSNRCATNGTKCSDCTTNLDCDGKECNLATKSCPTATLPNEAYCVKPGNCASNNCTGFPRRCKP